MQKMLAVLFFVILLAGCYELPPDAKLINETEINNIHQYAKTHNYELLDDIETLTIAKATEIALANNPNIKVFLANLRSAKMRYYQSLSTYLPALNATFSTGQQMYNRSGSTSSPPSQNDFYLTSNVQASWLLFDGLEREFNMFMAEHTEKQADYLYKNSKRLVVQGVQVAFCDVVIASAMLEIKESNFAFQNSQYQQAVSRFALGDVSKIDYLNFEGKLKQAQIDIVNAKNRLNIATYALANLMGFPDGVLKTDLKFEKITYQDSEIIEDINFFINNAIQTRPDLNAVRENLNVQKYKYYSTFSKYSPTIHAMANYQYNISTGRSSHGDKLLAAGGFYDRDSSFDYGVQASWNIFQGFYRYNKSREMKENLLGAYYSGSQDFLNIVQEIRNSYSTLEHNRELVRYTRELRDIYLQQRDLAAVEYWTGDVDIVRLDTAQDTYVSSENELVISLINSLKSKIILLSSSNYLEY